APADPAAVTAAPVSAREPGELLQLLVSHLRAGAAERVATRRAAAEQELAAELGRLDRYFESVLKEQADAEALATISALAEHRRSVCGEDFCADHGTAECRVDGLPACDEHVQVCPSCRLEHCTAHARVCAEDGHAACSACLAPCGSCGREVCNRHAQHSQADA